MFHTILVPLDGSAFAEQALPTALTLARRCQAALHLARAHVLYAFDDAAASWMPFDPAADAECRQHEQHYLAAMAQRCQELLPAPVAAAVLTGEPASAILAHSQHVAADLIVMTTHGRGPINRSYFGSIADELVRTCPFPLLLIRPQEVLVDLGSEPTFQKVLIPLDRSPLAEQILEPAIALGTAMQASYRLLSVVQPNTELAHQTPADRAAGLHRSVCESEVEAASNYLNQVADRLRARSLTVETHVVIHSHVPSAIMEESQSSACDVIALATRGRSGWKRWLLGSVADKVLRGSSLPVLLYHGPPPT
jgi:nucleotide-binding universal stress UspA family protein